MMQSDSAKVESYFERRALQFDSLYEEGSGLGHYFNKIFRKALWDRVRLTIEEFEDLQDFTVLDVGCGSGRNSVMFVEAGARKVVGVDFSAPMIQLAHEFSRSRGKQQQCEFIEADFAQYQFSDQFDFAVALGVFDYIADPRPTLERMKSLTRRKVVGSFPGLSILRAPLRKVRYAMRNCPVYFFSRSELEQACRDVGFARFRIVPCASSGHILVGEVG